MTMQINASLRNIGLYAVMLLILAVAIEAASYAAGRVLQSKWAMWRVPTPPQGVANPLSYQDYLTRRDPVLGWPSPSQYGSDYEPNGALFEPRYPEAGQSHASCISLYGDSFTEGGDISAPEHRWSSELSGLAGCYVANFGVGGYGTDQAYLRYIKHAADRPPIVIFGIHPADVTRNLTRIRDLENSEQWFALKPRFILESNSPRLVPIPDLTETEYRRVLTLSGDQLVLEHENLHPGGPAGVVKLEFPYSASVVQNMLKYYGFHSRLLRRPDWMAFLEPGHRLQGLEITVEITRLFVAEARERKSEPVILILPHLEDLRYHESHGIWPYQALRDELQTGDFAMMDFGPELLRTSMAESRGIQEYFGPTNHYNDRGNARLSRYVFDNLKKLGMITEEEGESGG
jgi:hypothetical protein